MNCQQLTQVPVALEIVQNSGDGRLQDLFNCIYRLFQESFLGWIGKRYAAHPDKYAIREDAKDAFQNGVIAFYRRSQEKEFSIKGSLKTTLYSFGLLQLLALFKKEKKGRRYKIPLPEADLFLDDAFLEAERQQLLSEGEKRIVEALNGLPPKMREMLLLKFFEGLSAREIAALLHVSAGHVYNEGAKAYKLLRQTLQNESSIQKRQHGPDR